MKENVNTAMCIVSTVLQYIYIYQHGSEGHDTETIGWVYTSRAAKHLTNWYRAK